MTLQLHPSSYIVLGLIEQAGQATPYELKQLVSASVGNFWSVPHSRLYAEPARLARGGYLRQRSERGGRRRKLYSLTDEGRVVLESWRASPADGLPELRDPGLLKLFFGADAKALAIDRAEAHRQKLAEYETRLALDQGSEPRGPWQTLEAGVAHEREWVRFWSKLGD